MKMRLYHVGDRAIPEPDVHYGRRNADFGQGFYLTPAAAKQLRWLGAEALSRPDEETRRREAADYQRAFAAALAALTGEE